MVASPRGEAPTGWSQHLASRFAGQPVKPVAARLPGDERALQGEFVLTEQRPRMQSRADVAPLARGQAVIFAVNERPVRGTKGVYRVKMRHGVSRIREGSRYTMGVIFHDAA